MGRTRAVGGVGPVVALVVLGAVAVLGGCDGGSGGESSAPRRHPGTTTTTAAQTRPPGRVRVFVLNGAGVPGAAAAKADQLRTRGYAVAGVGNAPHQQGTAVACRKGLVSEAAALANAVGPGTTIVPFPDPEPAGVAAADCIVGLGRA